MKSSRMKVFLKKKNSYQTPLPVKLMNCDMN